MATITREFENGNMLVKKDGVLVRTVTPAQIQARVDALQARITAVTAHKTEVEGWKTSAEATA